MPEPEWWAKAREMKERNPRLSSGAIGRILKKNGSSVRNALASEEFRERKRALARKRHEKKRRRREAKKKYWAANKHKYKKPPMTQEQREAYNAKRRKAYRELFDGYTSPRRAGSCAIRAERSGPVAQLPRQRGAIEERQGSPL